MIDAMILAHLIGDYLLQTDRLARWKARSLNGVLAHGTVVAAVTLLCALLVDWRWWPWALLIGLAHIGIDAARLRLGASFPALPLFVLDQAAHGAVIAAALVASGSVAPLDQALLTALLANGPLPLLAIGYVAATLPAWVMVEFASAGLARGAAPDFTQADNKYLGSVERVLIVTFVLLGHEALAPLLAAPRLFLQQGAFAPPRSSLWLAQWLTSVALALGVGLALRAAL